MASGIRTRDYTTIDIAVTLIQHAVETVGFDTRSDDGYEFFASEGMNGDPDDLSDYAYMHLYTQLLQLAADALDELEEGQYRGDS